MDLDKDYIIWITSLKDKIRSVQLKAAISVNEHLIRLYWDIGKSISEKQRENNWGIKVVEQVAMDLKRELPNTNGFSRTNLFGMSKFYVFYKDFLIVQQPVGLLGNEFGRKEIVQQPAGLLHEDAILTKIPWGHHQVILSKCKNEKEAFFYMQQTTQNNWSRNILQIQIKSGLFHRQGK